MDNKEFIDKLEELNLRDEQFKKAIIKNVDKLTIEEKESLHKIFFNKDTSSDIKSVLEHAVFKKIPPTPEEFLDPKHKWLPEDVIVSIYPHVKKDFIKIINGSKDFSTISMYGATRLGKTLMARLLIIYTIVFIHHLRYPQLYYNLSPMTKLAIYFISFKFDKTRQLYLQHIYNYLDHSDRFIRVKFQDQVSKEQAKYGCEKIVWSKASIVGEITLDSGLQLILGNKNPDEIIGADIIQCYISEITFFINQAGATEDDIFDLYTNADDRIRATVGNDYLTWVFLDSSANYEDSKIEKYILEELQYNKNTYFTWRSQWEARPHIFPRWYRGYNKFKKQGLDIDEFNRKMYESGYTFKVITGNGDIPARLVEKGDDISSIPVDLIDHVPIDVYFSYKRNPLKSIKDIGGKPTSKDSRFIQSKQLLNILFDNPYLENIEGGIVADASEQPERLIWNKIEHKFFARVDKRYVIKRAHKEPRFLAIDTAFSTKGDLFGLGMVHLEWSRELDENIVVTDFAFPLLPGKEGINLTAVEKFIIELVILGNLKIIEVNADSFQSEQTMQNLKRYNIEAKKQSVDKYLSPYQNMLTLLINEQLKAGKNIFLKNNLLSLERKKEDGKKEKIDHTKGNTVNQYYGDFENSQAGVHAKDVSDTIASASFSATNSTIQPVTIYEDENRKWMKDKKTIDTVVQEHYKELHQFY